jgi:hypothetical protein
MKDQQFDREAYDRQVKEAFADPQIPERGRSGYGRPDFNRVYAAFQALDGRQIRAGSETSCPAPNHGKRRGDKKPSLLISLDDRGVGMFCRSGCSTEDEILPRLGLTLSDLFRDPLKGRFDLSTQDPKLPRTQEDMAHHSTNARGTATGGTEEKENDGEMDWLLREHAAGRIPVDVEGLLPPRPRGLSDPDWEVLRFFVLCVALRRWVDMPSPYEVLFSRYWVAERTGLHEQTVKRAIAKLRRPTHPMATGGLLLFVREERPRRDRDQARGTYVYAPGWLVDTEPLAEEVAVGGVVAGGPELGEEVREEPAVFGAEPADGRERAERDG